jgi:centromeric protein E
MSKNHASKVAVSIRVRPLNAREKAAPACYEHFKRSAKTTLTEYTPNGQPRPKTTCEFDHVFSPEDTTDDLFDSVAKPVVDSALEGVNGTIFAYGQTSSGKTFTMNGDEKMDFPGILPLSALHIFDKIEHCSREYLVRVSFVEIYNEIVTDLLNPGAGQIKIRESRERGVFV